MDTDKQAGAAPSGTVRSVVRWAAVGNGKKLHWFDDAVTGDNRALCGIGPRGMYIEPWREDQKCEHCRRLLGTSNAEAERR